MTKKSDPYMIDDENPEWTREDFRNARPARDVLEEQFGKQAADDIINKRVGRPVAQNPKQPVTIRLDSEIVDAYRATGKGWQTLMNDVLRNSLPEIHPEA